jgi:hypothetical protein
MHSARQATGEVYIQALLALNTSTLRESSRAIRPKRRIRTIADIEMAFRSMQPCHVSPISRIDWNVFN